MYRAIIGKTGVHILTGPETEIKHLVFSAQGEHTEAELRAVFNLVRCANMGHAVCNVVPVEHWTEIPNLVQASLMTLGDEGVCGISVGSYDPLIVMIDPDEDILERIKTFCLLATIGLYLQILPARLERMSPHEKHN